MSKAYEKYGVIKVSPPKEWAAGIPAVVSAYQHVSAKVGPFAGNKLLSELNQLKGFDCPGCAWPDPLHERSKFEFCENGAKAVADEATLARADARFFKRHSMSELRQKSDRWLNEQGRIVEPMILRQGSEHYQPVSWDEAMQLIADMLKSLPEPDQAAFYTSGRTSNEAAFLYQLFVRMYGTNNLPDCSNLCHESSGVGLKETIGVGKGTVTLEDLYHAEAIFVFGQNPGSNHPRMLSALQKAKHNGASIITVNPLDETGLKRFKNPQQVNGVIGAGTPLRDQHLAVRINGDVALLKGLCKALFEAEDKQGNVLDRDFIDEFCANFTAFRQDIEQSSWDELERGSGVSKADILAAAGVLIKSSKTVFCWAMGMTQHKNAVANIQLMTNTLMLQGNLGKPGAGVCPVRGHSNVQGDRTMGIWEKPSQALLDALGKAFDFTPPRRYGVDTVECIEAMAQQRIKMLFCIGGNFYRAAPDHDVTADALQHCQLTVQVSTKLNRSHLHGGQTALILPALGRTELDMQNGSMQVVTVENSMGVVQTSAGRRKPASAHCRSEVAIVADLAERTLGKAQVDWQHMVNDYSVIRDYIEQVIPGFDMFNARLEKEGEFVLPNPVRDHRHFDTDSGKANFIVHPVADWDLPADRLLMMTIRSHDQFNTTVYSNNDRYRGIAGGRMVVFLHEADIRELELRAGDTVTLTSHTPLTGGEEITRTQSGFTVIPYAIPRGCAAAYYPETNNLIPIQAVAEKSNTPAYKSVIISVHKDLP